MTDRARRKAPGEVLTHLDPTSAVSRRVTARLLNEFDVVSIQHEYGIFGPDDGIGVLDLLEPVQAHTIVTLHTVLARPTPRQRRILLELIQRADRVVVLSRAALDTLLRHYPMEAAKVEVIPHGAHGLGNRSKERGPRPEVLTWGLIGPGKGLEWSIQAMALLSDLDPAPIYRIAGQTHPKVRRIYGESYRDSLCELITKCGLEETVLFEDRYLGSEELDQLLSAADVVVLPYESEEQVTSGVLIEALAGHKPVLATRFPHAVELLSSGAGVLVNRGDPAAIADALRPLLSDPRLRRRMAERAAVISADFDWRRVAASYERLAAEVALGPPVVA